MFTRNEAESYKVSTVQRKDSPKEGEKNFHLTFKFHGKIKDKLYFFYECDCGNYTSCRSHSSIRKGIKKKDCGCRLWRDKRDYLKFISDQKHQLSKAGILYLSQDQWKNDKIPYWCHVHKSYNLISKASLRMFGNQPCSKCGREVAAKKKLKTTEQFIKDSKEVWGKDTFDYSETIYTGSHNKVILLCKKGTEFSQSATDHLSGYVGCPCCNNGRCGFDKNKSGWFYLFKWTHPDGRSFLKYGVTNSSVVESRAKKQKTRREGIVFDYEQVESVYFKDGSSCYDFEQYIANKYGKNYISKEEFPDGFSETTSTENLTSILKDLDALLKTRMEYNLTEINNEKILQKIYF